MQVFRSMALKSRLFLGCSLFALLALPVAAQVVTDGTAGSATTLAGPNYTVPQSLGTTNGAGTTVLHSFSQFDLVNGDTATFTGNATITDVVARITGGSSSSINGTVNVAIPNANLYLLNPDGIVIGPNGYFNVPGSLYVATANSLNFADQSSIAIAATPVGTLSSAPITAFGFFGGGIGDVTVNGVSSVSNGVTSYSFHGFVGGDITLVGANLFINDSTFNAGSATLTELRFGAIGQSDAVIGRSGQFQSYGGNLTITGSATSQKSDLYLSGGQITVQSSTSTARSNLTVVANDPTSISGQRLSGSIFVQGDDMSLSGSLASSTYANPDAYAPGSINVTLTGDLMANGAYIGGSAPSSGQAYDVTISARSVTLDNATNVMAFGSSNNGGIITITTAEDLTLSNNSHLFAGTVGPGNSGSIVANIGDLLSLSAGSGGSGFGVYSNYNGSGSGAAGVIQVQTNRLNVNNGEFAFQAFYGDRSGGTMHLHVTGDASVINSTALPVFSGFGAGGGGTLTMNVGGNFNANGSLLNLSSGSSAGSRNGGIVNLAVSGDFVASDAIFDVSTTSGNANQAGNGGNITLTAHNISTVNSRFMLGAGLLFGSNINRSGGNLRITSTQAASFSGGLDLFDVSSNAGSGGSIRVDAGTNLLLESAEIDAGTFVAGAQGGTIELNAGGTITDHSTSVFNDGGDITLTASQIDLLSDGFMRLSTDSESGTGGQILLQAPIINLGMDLSRDGGSVLLEAGPRGAIVVRARTLNMDAVDFVSDARPVVGDPLEPDKTHAVHDAGAIGIYANEMVMGPNTSIQTYAGDDAGSITLGATNLVSTGGSIKTSGATSGFIRLAADDSMNVSNLTVSSTVASAGSDLNGGNIYVGVTLEEPSFSGRACQGACVAVHPFSTSWTPGTQTGIPTSYFNDSSNFSILGSSGQVIMGIGGITAPEAVLVTPQATSTPSAPDDPAETGSGVAFAYGDNQDATNVCAVEDARRKRRNTFISAPEDFVVSVPGALRPLRYGEVSTVGALAEQLSLGCMNDIKPVNDEDKLTSGAGS